MSNASLLSIDKVTKIYRTSERAFIPGLADLYEKTRDLGDLRKTFSAKKLLSAYRDIKTVVESKAEEFRRKDSVLQRARFLRELIVKEDEFAVTALLNVSLDIRQGEFLALAGPSGSGKSTLLNIIASLEQPTYGQVLFEGRNLEDLSEDDRSDFRRLNLGFVFQAFNLIPVLSAYENIEYALILKEVSPPERRERVWEGLRYVGLENCAHRRPSKLSGGQQQRVAIARALAASPKLILADEPTANLDSKTAAGILDLMQKINRDRGTTFLFSSHDALILERARRVVHLRDGSILSDDKNASLVAHEAASVS
ncbi:MAG: ATP-binding cassette domain-containing protein [Elusimicrobia bacterium]|nr:ATP-binding cassette domain-containing protein [Elusimicrobiota bacterium]